MNAPRRICEEAHDSEVCNDDTNSDSVTHEKISLEDGFWWYFSRISCVSKHLRCDMLTPFKSEEGGLSEYDRPPRVKLTI